MTEATQKETFENKQTATTEDITAVLHFDPFKKGEEIPEAKADTKVTGTDNAKPEDRDETKGAKAPSSEEKTNLPPSTKPAESTSKEADAWKQLAEERGKQLEVAAPKKTEKENGLKIPEFDYTISDEHIEALGSQDPKVFKGGVAALAKGLSAGIFAHIVNHLHESYNPRFDSIPVQMMNVLAAKEQADNVRKDFYGTYPELDHPQLKGLIEQVGKAKAKELGKTVWDKELRDATAKEVKGILGAFTPANGKDSSPPPRMLPAQGARPTVTQGDDLARDIAETLGF